KHEFQRSGRTAAVDNGFERLEFAYNSAGWLRSASAFLTISGASRQVDFWNVEAFDDQLGLPSRVARAGGAVVEEVKFTPETHRLRSLSAVGPRPAEGPLISLSYSEYDALGNLAAMRDIRSQTDYSFRYDSVYRLRTGSGLNLAGGTGAPFDLLY